MGKYALEGNGTPFLAFCWRLGVMMGAGAKQRGSVERTCLLADHLATNRLSILCPFIKRENYRSVLRTSFRAELSRGCESVS